MNRPPRRRENAAPPIELRAHPGWPVIAGVRLQGQCRVPYAVSGLDLDKSYGERFHQAGLPALLKIRFEKACRSFAQLHGQRAANDFRPSDERPADAYHEAARMALRAGKEGREETSSGAAPGETGARIGAALWKVESGNEEGGNGESRNEESGNGERGNEADKNGPGGMEGG